MHYLIMHPVDYETRNASLVPLWPYGIGSGGSGKTTRNGDDSIFKDLIRSQLVEDITRWRYVDRTDPDASDRLPTRRRGRGTGFSKLPETPGVGAKALCEVRFLFSYLSHSPAVNRARARRFQGPDIPLRTDLPPVGAAGLPR